MRRFSTRSIIVSAAAAVALVASPLAFQPAGAIPAADSACTYVPPPGIGITSAQISYYPGNPGSMSGLEVGCVFRNDTGNSKISGAFTIHDGSLSMWHNGAARTVTTSGVTGSGSSTIQLNTGSNGVAGMPTGTVNRIITGHAGLQARVFVTSQTVGGLLTLNRPTIASIPSGTALKVENASGARSTVDALWGVGTFVVTSATANFNAADVGLSIGGTGIPAYSTIASVAGNTATFTNSGGNPTTTDAVAVPGPGQIGPQTISVGSSLRTTTVRQVSGVTTTSTTRFFSSGAVPFAGAGGAWQASDLGLRVTGTCLNGAAPDTVVPANTYVTNIASAANLDTTGGLVSGWSECTIVVGEPNANAPANGDVVANQGVQLNLSPGVVGGTDDCANEQPEGFSVVATWENPGSFQGTGGSNTPPLGTKSIGQLLISTGAGITYSAFVVERKLASFGDPNPGLHYDVVFPFAPTALAMCPASPNSPGLSFLLDIEAITRTQSLLPTGTGRPGTGQVRNIEGDNGAGYSATVFVDSQGANAFTPAVNFQRACVFPAPPTPINFQCGAG